MPNILSRIVVDGLSSNAKLFVDDTSLFLLFHNVDTSPYELNNDLFQINKWSFQWKMSFNADTSKQVQEIILVGKLRKFFILCYVLITALFRKPHIKKNLGIFPDARLIFQEHLKVITTKLNKTIGLLWKLKLCQDRY